MHMISKKDLSNAEMKFDEIVQSYDSHNRQLRSAKRMKRLQCMSKNWKNFLNMKVSENKFAALSFGKFFDETGIPTNGSTVKNHISLTLSRQ